MADKKGYMKQVESGVVSNPDVIVEANKALLDMRLQKQLELDNQLLQKRLFDVVSNNLRVLEPKSEFEKLDEYWDVYKQLHANDFAKKMVEFDARLGQLDKAIAAREERVRELTGDEQ